MIPNSPNGLYCMCIPNFQDRKFTAKELLGVETVPDQGESQLGFCWFWINLESTFLPLTLHLNYGTDFIEPGIDFLGQFTITRA